MLFRAFFDKKSAFFGIVFLSFFGAEITRRGNARFENRLRFVEIFLLAFRGFTGSDDEKRLLEKPVVGVFDHHDPFRTPFNHKNPSVLLLFLLIFGKKCEKYSAFARKKRQNRARLARRAKKAWGRRKSAEL
ncbi:MAG: hypothetical protein K6D98_00240 [Clostridiales bacterium]|nr:hypothetical protein [Clostridiales bacterium]